MKWLLQAKKWSGHVYMCLGYRFCICFYDFAFRFWDCFYDFKILGLFLRLSDFGTVSTTLRFWDCFYDFQILGLFRQCESLSFHLIMLPS